MALLYVEAMGVTLNIYLEWNLSDKLQTGWVAVSKFSCDFEFFPCTATV